MAKKRKIYDEDNVEIEVTPASEQLAVSEEAEVFKTSSKTNKKKNATISVGDVFDAFASYINPKFSVIEANTGSGKCVICGKDTAYSIRKICVDCMETYSEQIYEKAKDAIANGEVEIKL